MKELLANALAFLRAVLRFRWTVLLVAWSIAAIGWTFVYTLDELYIARARVVVDSNRILEPLLKGLAVQPDVNQRVNMLSRTVLSRPNLEKLARMADIDLDASTDQDKERLLDGLARTVKLNGSKGNDSLYSLTYTHTDPKVALRVVRSLITVFIESTLGDERKDSVSAQAFLDQQLLDYETRLLAAERRLSDFKRENAGRMPGESGGYYQRLDMVTNAERAARLELSEAENRRNTLRRQVRDERPTVSVGEAGGTSSLDAQLLAQSQELSALLVRYTDRHPRVAQLRESIAALEGRRAIEREAGSDDRAGSLVASPVYQELRALLAEAEARVSALQVRVREYGKQLEELNATVDSIPKVEAQLQQLDRDYKIVKSQYETLLERRESARLSEQVEQNADDVKFQVIDPPFVPSKPSSPNKLMMSGMVTVVALGGGAAIAFLLSLLFPVFYEADAVAARVGRPALGTVSRRLPAGARLRRGLGWCLWIALAAAFAAAFALLAALHLGLLDAARLEPLLRSVLGPALGVVSDAVPGLVERGRSLLGG